MASQPSEETIQEIMAKAFDADGGEGLDLLDAEARALLCAVMSTGLAEAGREGAAVEKSEISIMARFHREEGPADPNGSAAAPKTGPWEDLDTSDSGVAELEAIGAFLAAVEGAGERPPPAIMDAAHKLWRPDAAHKISSPWPAWLSWLSALGTVPALAAAAVVAVLGVAPAGVAVYASLKAPRSAPAAPPTLLAKADTAPKLRSAPAPSATVGPDAFRDSTTQSVSVSGFERSSGDRTISSPDTINAFPAESAAPGTANQGAGWSSVAVATSGVGFGVSSREGTPQAAEAAALAACAKTGARDCELRKPSPGQCLALASASNGRVTSATAPTLAEASRAAEQDCREAAGAACRLEWTRCAPAQ